MRTILVVLLTMTLSSCGTAKGVLDGTGAVLEGMAKDVRGVGGFLD